MFDDSKPGALQRARRVLGLLPCLASLACGPATTADGPEDEELPILPFERCPRFTDTGADEAECATVELALFHDQPEGKTLPIFVKRYPATARRRGQLWVLTGGPGLAGTRSEYLADRFARALPDLDVYIPDHRGAGRSAYLECPNQGGTGLDAQGIEACGRTLASARGPDLDAFRTTEAAWDVAQLIEQTRTSRDRVFVHGASYGGFWLHRVLQVAPDLVDGAVFESSLRIPFSNGFLEGVLAPDEAGRTLLERCAEEEECHAHLGDDPYGFARAVLQDGSCPGLDMPPEVLYPLLVGALEDSMKRWALPAFFWRAARCNDADQEWMGTFLRTTSLPSNPTEPREEVPGYSQALNFHIHASEIDGPPFDPADPETIAQERVFHNAYRLSVLHQGYREWPVYPVDEYADAWADGSQPVLVVHGSLDPRTAPSGSREIAQNLGPRARFVEVPDAAHGVAGWDRGTPRNCGFEIMAQFLQAPDATLDLSCLDAVPSFLPPDPTWLQAALKDTDLWGEP